MFRRLHIITLMAICTICKAQTHMRIHHKDGGYSDVPVERVDSITFVDRSEKTYDVSIIGEWMWASKEKGYYEVLTFNEDRTYTGYDFYLEYGFDTWTYGTYMANGSMLNLWSNGYGYRRTYRWFVTGLTEKALELMTQMGRFTYHRVQPNVLRLVAGGAPLACEDGYQFIFADETKALIKDGELYGISTGTTYVQQCEVSTGDITAYKVIVE